jgi:hypothetical protein
MKHCKQQSSPSLIDFTSFLPLQLDKIATTSQHHILSLFFIQEHENPLQLRLNCHRYALITFFIVSIPSISFSLRRLIFCCRGSQKKCKQLETGSKRVTIQKTVRPPEVKKGERHKKEIYWVEKTD